MPDCKAGWETYPHRTRVGAGILSMTSVGIGMSADECVSSLRFSTIGIVKAGTALEEAGYEVIEAVSDGEAPRLL